MKKKRKLKKGRVLLVILLLLLLPSVLLYFSFNKKSSKKIEPKEEKTEPIEVKPEKKSMSLIMVGDAVIHNGIYLDARVSGDTYDFKDMFTYIKDEIKDYDLKYYNQETIIGGKNLGLSNYPRFNSPDEIGSDLVATGFNLVSLATNHTMDKNEEGVLYTVDFWKTQNAITSGAYSSFEERDNIKVNEQNGIKYAFLSYTTSTNGLPVPSGKEYLVNVYSEEKVKEDIEKIKDKVDVIIVAMHWGEEYTHTPVQSEKDIAGYLSSLGVNLIIGSHPHVIQPVDYINDTLVIYSLGNFISAQHSLGIDKIIGLMVGLDINVEDGKVTFDNIDKQLIYTYCTSAYKDFKIYPFSKLDDSILNNYKSIEEEYMNIVNTKVEY
ncbi:MAG: CapA family protein [bacterium]|nr:CapA family protein [bacterium]